MFDRLSLRDVTLSAFAILLTVAVAFPVVASMSNTRFVRYSLNNARVIGAGVALYAQDFDDTIPRMDNNGSCFYLGVSPPGTSQLACDYPDWGNFRLPLDGLEAGKSVMFFGAMRSYMGNRPPAHDLALGRTDWKRVEEVSGELGVAIDHPFRPELIDFYNFSMPQPAVNMFAIDYGPVVGVGAGANYSNTRPLAPRGNLNRFVHPQTTILIAMQSAWDWNRAVETKLGNGAVWASIYNTGCTNARSDGWTWYALPRNERQDVRSLQGQAISLYGSPKRATENPNLQGMAMFLFADLHAEPMVYPAAEQCIPTPDGRPWQVTGSGGTYMMYHPYWVPELDFQ